jgi:hypothetical protein
MTGLYLIALKKLKKLKDPTDIHNEIIRFPTVFEALCRSFQITKDDCWEMLFAFQDFGFIDVIRFQGVRINKKMCSKVGI